MSGAALQKTIDNAFKTVAGVVGYKFKQYRPYSYIVPLKDTNYISTLNLAASPDEGFTKNPLDALDKYFLYAKSTELARGDILYSEELDKTYVVIDKSELRAAVGVLAQERMTVLRPTIGTGDKKTVLEEVATEVPCAIKTVGSSGSAGALSTTSSTMTAGSHELEVWTYITPGNIRLQDVIEVFGNRYICTFAQSTTNGTNIKMRSTKVGI